MEGEILKMVVSYGIFAVLFCYLFFYMLKDAKVREEKYQELLDKLTEKFNVVEDIKTNVEEIKAKIK